MKSIILKTTISIAIMIIASILGFYLGSTIMPCEFTAILCTMIAGFACTIFVIGSNNKKQ